MNLAEVQIYGFVPVNGRSALSIVGASASSRHDDHHANEVVCDGNSGTYVVTKTLANNWVQIDFGERKQVHLVQIQNIWHTAYSLRLGDYEVWVGNHVTQPEKLCFTGSVGADSNLALGPWVVDCVSCSLQRF